MYSEYTTHFTHNIQFVYPVYNLYCIVHTDYTDSQCVNVMNDDNVGMSTRAF